MKTSIMAALGAVLLAPALAFAQEQTSDQSGAITFLVGIAPYVEVVNHDASLHILEPAWEARGGVIPGYGISSGSIHATNPVMREVRANTPYRLSIDGITPDSRIVFTSEHGDELTLTAVCDHLRSPDPAIRTLATIFDCRGSTPFQPSATGSMWLLFHAYTPLRTDTNGAMAGTYTATIYFQIDAA